MADVDERFGIGLRNPVRRCSGEAGTKRTDEANPPTVFGFRRRKREPFAEANRPKGGFYGMLFRTDMLVHDACANIVRIDWRLSDRGHGGAERIHGMTARRDDMTARSDARDSVPDNGTGGNRQKTG